MTEREEIQRDETLFMKELKKNSGTAIGMGVFLLLLGFLAMVAPMFAGASIAMIVGIALLLGGIGQLIFAFKSGMGLFSILFAVLTIIMGGYMLANLDAALGALTIFLAVYLIVSGFAEIMVAYQARPAEGAGWAMFSGFLSVILGALIWSQFPLSGAWAIGILLGIRLLFSGLSLMMLGFAARNA
jgi:uncharacterized membrane protein HdeD (DUF308 family)